jgi:hypothetical protein
MRNDGVASPPARDKLGVAGTVLVVVYTVPTSCRFYILVVQYELLLL